jgi:hypothetical protein
MGDRTYSWVDVLEKDLPVFEELGYDTEFVSIERCRNAAGAIRVVDEEANYGNFDELLKLAKKGHVFQAWHDAGDSYPAALIVSDGEGFESVFSDTNLNMLAPFNDDGLLSEETLAHVMRFTKIRQNMAAKMKAAHDPSVCAKALLKEIKNGKLSLSDLLREARDGPGTEIE